MTDYKFGTWYPIESAPKRFVIFACDLKNGYESKVIFINGEWECIDWKGFGTGVGFYPTHWTLLPLPPVPGKEE